MNPALNLKKGLAGDRGGSEPRHHGVSSVSPDTRLLIPTVLDPIEEHTTPKKKPPLAGNMAKEKQRRANRLALNQTDPKISNPLRQRNGEGRRNASDAKAATSF